RKTFMWLAATTVIALLSSPSFGQPPEPLLFRRVFVPEEALGSQIRGLLPLKREEFERRLASAAKQTDPAANKTAVRIERAVFRARLEGSDLKNGEAELTVVAATDQPAILSLEPCRVALESAVWQSGKRGPVIIGAD